MFTYYKTTIKLQSWRLNIFIMNIIFLFVCMGTGVLHQYLTCSIVIFAENVRNQETEVPSDGLRQRLTASQPSEAQQSSEPYSGTANGQFPPIDPRTFWAGAMTNPYASTPGYDPNSMSQQLIWMQQAYAQYVTQYMQL